MLICLILIDQLLTIEICFSFGKDLLVKRGYVIDINDIYINGLIYGMNGTELENIYSSIVDLIGSIFCAVHPRSCICTAVDEFPLDMLECTICEWWFDFRNRNVVLSCGWLMLQAHSSYCILALRKC